MKKLQVKCPKYASIFGGIGFHNNEAMLYPLIEKEHFNQVLCKCYREMSPSFMRTFGGYDDWSRESMDAFAEYYEQMQKVTDTPIYLAAAKGKMHFSEEEMESYCENVAENLRYLKQDKGVKHLRYYCFSNEMSQCGWGDLMKDLPLFKRYHEMLYRALQNRSVDIGLLATDASEYENWATVDWAIKNMSRISEDYCVHIYERAHGIDDLDFYDFFYEKCNEIVMKAIKNDGKRVILGEVGIQKNFGQLTHGNGVVIDVCRYYDDDYDRTHCGLMQAEMAFSAINAGIFAIAYWSYTDYPTPYSCAYSEKEGYAKKWGECEKFVSGTTDVKYNKWGFFRWEDDGDYSPKEPLWALAPMMKLFKRNAKVLDIQVKDKNLRCCGLMNKDGSVSIGIVNRNNKPVEIQLDSSLFGKNLRVYEYDSNNVPYNPFGDMQDCIAVLDKEAPVYELKPQSVTYFTTDYREKTAPVYAEDVELCKLEGSDESCCVGNDLGEVSGEDITGETFLRWSAVNDPEHCYYRVYASDEEEFIPSASNQIASTVALSLPVSVCNRKKYYNVLSVDNYGNV